MKQVGTLKKGVIHEDLARILAQVEIELDKLKDLPDVDTILFEKAKWKILLSESFRTSFKKLDSPEKKKLVLNLLLRLSYGLRPRRRKVDILCDNSKHILKHFRVRDVYVICSVDLVKDSGLCNQVLKVWDIMSLMDMPALIKRLDAVFSLHTEEYISRCKEKSLEGLLEVPKSWKHDITHYKSSSDAETGCHPSGDASVNHCLTCDSLMLMKFYSLSSGIIWHLLSGCDGQEVDFPFELSDQEKEIVQFGKSSFVLGRSGSGKTTVLVMKLFQREQLHHNALRGYHEHGDAIETEGQSVLKQLFVTVNPRLCHVVKQHISRLKRSTCGWNLSAESYDIDLDEIDETFLSSDFPDSFVDIPSSFFPLVVTFRKFLLMLDCTVGVSFFDRFPEVRAFQEEKRKSSKTLTFQTFIRTREVSYEKFSSSYWPYMNVKLIKRVEPFLVFTEITSHIKGGAQDLESSDGHLSREDYVSRSERRLSNLTEQERCRIYDIYLEYEKRKDKNGEFDLADFVSDIHGRLRVEGYKCDQMEFVYIDEIQDLTMKQIAIFKHVCTNFKEGFLFAGDTAQAISKGVEFRFKDIRSLFYRTFTMDSGHFASSSTNAKRQISDVLQLSQNFRTHAGVLKLAQSVIDLIYHFFPHSIDELNPETSLVNGVTPVLLQSVDSKGIFKSMSEIILGADKRSVEFGADQVILVRNAEVKNDVLGQVGRGALVLTILECKGLEFEDVLLYNFFGSSPVADQWELLNGYMRALNMPSALDESHSQHFKDEKLMLLCHELKLLYVAITRTRERIWIFDEIGSPMLELWKHKGIVQLQHFDNEFLALMLVPSTPSSWKKRGSKFFHVENYEMARICFQKAGETYWEKYCHACELRSSADRMRGVNPQIFRLHLLQAAEIYESIGKAESAAQCYFDLNEYKEAGELFLVASKLKEAGECFHLARYYERAAEVYSKCNSYVKCLSVLVEGKLFETGYDYIQRWRNDGGTFEGVEVMKFLEKGAIHFHKREDYEKMMVFVRAFTSKDLMRSFLVNKYLLDQLLHLEEEWGNYLEAADVAGRLGLDTIAAVHFERVERYQEACQVIVRHVLGESLWGNGNLGWPINDFEGKEQLLNQVKTCAGHVSDGYLEFVCEEVAILTCEKNSNSDLQVLQERFDCFQTHGSIQNQILCARQIIDAKCTRKDVLVANIVDYTRHGNMSWTRLRFLYLVSFWKRLKANIDIIIDYCKGDGHGGSHGQFCMDYLGVREQLSDRETRYLVLYPNAPWVSASSSSQTPQNQKKSVTMDCNNFWRHARAYWFSEIIIVGSEVLGRLEKVYEHCVHESLSIYCRIKLLIHIFELSKCLSTSKLTADLVQRFVEHYTENVLNIHFIEWQDSWRNDMINARGLVEFRAPLEKVLLCYVKKIPTELTRRDIAKVTTVALSTNLPHHKQEKLVTSLKKKAVVGQLCIDKFVGLFEIVTSKPEPDETPAELCMVHKLHQALEHMYYAESDDEPMSPNALVYLLDRLLILALAWKGCFHAPRSSVLEWLMYNGWRNPCSSFILTEEQQTTVEAAAELVAGIVKDLFHNTRLNAKEFNPLVVLRLAIIIGILITNTGKCSDLLSHILGGTEYSSMLPKEFSDRLSHGDFEDFSEALNSISNPLVCVDLKGSWCPRPQPCGVIFLDMQKLCDQRREILDTLSPRGNTPASNNRRSPFGQNRNMQ